MYIYIYVCSSKGVYVMIECVCVCLFASFCKEGCKGRCKRLAGLALEASRTYFAGSYKNDFFVSNPSTSRF